VCVRRLVHDCNMAEEESADRYAELAKHACCRTLNFGYVVVKKPISKRTPMHSTGPLTAAKPVKATKLKETTAPIAVRDMTVGMRSLPMARGLDAHGMRRWRVWQRCIWFLPQSAGAEPLVEVRGGSAMLLRATLAEKKHIEKIRLATGLHGRKGPTF
jgi:hypothetical protein